MAMQLGDNVIEAKVQKWLEWDRNDVTRAQVNKLATDKDIGYLRNIMCSKLEFGTAGIRAAMEAGFGRLNDLTIIQITQGMCKYALTKCSEVKEKGIVIGFDGRHNSHRFAQLAAAVFLHAGIKVYLFPVVCPTPFVAYSVAKLQCEWGVMVTASHNPKEDNGYKVYGSNGAQIIAPHDKGITACIEECEEPQASSWDTSIVKVGALCLDPFTEVNASYMDDLRKLSFHRSLCEASPLVYTYTAMHGVGTRYIRSAADVFGIKHLAEVDAQAEPNGDFPTVRFPNPEEGKSALNLAIEKAESVGSPIILATDPDADRFALAEKQPHGSWHIFSGNELGALFGWWIWQKMGQKYQGGEAVYMMSSTVSSKILRTIAQAEGFQFVETLTGFKWMGNKTYELVSNSKENVILFAFEEAIGFMCGSTVLDKDGVSACMLAAEMAAWVYSQGLNVHQQLHAIYKQYGYHLCKNSYFICHEPEKIRGIFERLRNYSGNNTYPEACGKYKIKHVRDLTTGFDSSQPDGKAILPTSKSSQMITFSFENKSVATLRTSGTEPKIKYYTELIASADMSREEAEAELHQLVDSLVEHFVQPTVHGIKPRED